MISSSLSRLSTRPSHPPLQVAAMALLLAGAASLLPAKAHAQAVEPTTTASAAEPASAPASAPSSAASAKRKYTPEELERAFNFIDGNHDGKISREEASGFRGVAKYFDAADSNKDNSLSAEEFRNAMNHP